MNHHHTLEALDVHATLASYGLIPPAGPVVPDGLWHRCPTTDHPRSHNGAFCVTESGRLLVQRWHLDARPIVALVGQAIDDATAAAVRRARQSMDNRRHAEAADRALRLWASARPADLAHPYIVRKGLAGTHGARQIGDAIVPAYGVRGEIRTLQFIAADGSKRFLRGGQKRGCYACIGGAPSTSLIICEGWATAASIHEATGVPIAVAGDAGNLRPVAEGFYRQYPALRLIIAADNDTNGVGEARAREAARAIGARVAMPPGVGDDWNDVACREGLAAVAAMIGEVRS